MTVTGEHGVLVFLVIAWQVQSLVAVDCHQGCFCSDSAIYRITSCMGTNLTTVPRDIPSDTKELYLLDNQIDSLPSNAFSHLPSLKILSFTDCGLKIIQPKAFSGLTQLTKLSLRSNKLEQLSSYTFKGLSSLRTLELDDNNLKVIQNFAFQDLNLTYVGLEGNQYLEEIEAKAFEGASVHEMYIYNSSLSDESALALQPLHSSLSVLLWQNNQRSLNLSRGVFRGFNLRQLLLNNNGIVDTGFLEHARVEGTLSLVDNPTGPIDFSKYQRLSSLQHVHLHNTGFNEVKAAYFSNLPHLSQLHLSSNEITRLEGALQPIFSRLRWLTLNDNPLHCNCELLWLRRWLATQEDSAGAVCETPFKSDLISADETAMTCSAPTMPSIQQSLETASPGVIILTCTADGDPAPTISWVDPSGQVLSGSIESSSLNRTTNVLRMETPDSATSSGKYICVAVNEEGNTSAISNISALQKNDPRSGSGSHPEHLTLFTLVAVTAVNSAVNIV